jgi:hypothetical protein
MLETFLISTQGLIDAPADPQLIAAIEVFRLQCVRRRDQFALNPSGLIARHRL